MSIKFSDVLDLFEFVNFGPAFVHQGYICKTTGKTYFYSEFDESDEELPEDIDEEKYLAIPYKNDLSLGRDLVYDFVQAYLPAEYKNVRAIFRRKGAYSRYKALLENTGKIDDWYQFEAKRTEQALRDWCSMQDVEICD